MMIAHFIKKGNLIMYKNELKKFKKLDNLPYYRGVTYQNAESERIWWWKHYVIFRKRDNI